MKKLIGKKRNPWLPVVAAIMRREKNILLGLRPEGGSLAGLWELPGGKIELGEQPERALARELKEELNIDAEIGHLLFATTHSYGEIGILILFYEVNYWHGQPQPEHHSNIKWVHLDEISNMPLSDANRNVLDRIIKLLK
ncbi:MAG: pyrophosphohydrolase [Bdellovibrionales bacterium RBG_16_40_8]|nr:MAG: pyrophosphohydrolase [Bdellovibrionales bacterium RBG_16_40_8]